MTSDEALQECTKLHHAAEDLRNKTTKELRDALINFGNINARLERLALKRIENPADKQRLAELRAEYNKRVSELQDAQAEIKRLSRDEGKLPRTSLELIIETQAARLQMQDRELRKARHDRDRFRARLDGVDKLLEIKELAQRMTAGVTITKLFTEDAYEIKFKGRDGCHNWMRLYDLVRDV